MCNTYSTGISNSDLCLEICVVLYYMCTQYRKGTISYTTTCNRETTVPYRCITFFHGAINNAIIRISLKTYYVNVLLFRNVPFRVYVYNINSIRVKYGEPAT